MYLSGRLGLKGSDQLRNFVDEIDYRLSKRGGGPGGGQQQLVPSKIQYGPPGSDNHSRSGGSGSQSQHQHQSLMYQTYSYPGAGSYERGGPAGGPPSLSRNATLTHSYSDKKPGSLHISRGHSAVITQSTSSSTYLNHGRLNSSSQTQKLNSQYNSSNNTSINSNHSQANMQSHGHTSHSHAQSIPGYYDQHPHTTYHGIGPGPSSQQSQSQYSKIENSKGYQYPSSYLGDHYHGPPSGPPPPPHHHHYANSVGGPSEDYQYSSNYEQQQYSDQYHHGPGGPPPGSIKSNSKTQQASSIHSPQYYDQYESIRQERAILRDREIALIEYERNLDRERQIDNMKYNSRDPREVPGPGPVREPGPPLIISDLQDSRAGYLSRNSLRNGHPVPVGPVGPTSSGVTSRPSPQQPSESQSQPSAAPGLTKSEATQPQYPPQYGKSTSEAAAVAPGGGPTLSDSAGTVTKSAISDKVSQISISELLRMRNLAQSQLHSDRNQKIQTNMTQGSNNSQGSEYGGGPGGAQQYQSDCHSQTLSGHNNTSSSGSKGGAGRSKVIRPQSSHLSHSRLRESHHRDRPQSRDNSNTQITNLNQQQNYQQQQQYQHSSIGTGSGPSAGPGSLSGTRPQKSLASLDEDTSSYGYTTFHEEGRDIYLQAYNQHEGGGGPGGILTSSSEGPGGPSRKQSGSDYDQYYRNNNYIIGGPGPGPGPGSSSDHSQQYPQTQQSYDQQYESHDQSERRREVQGGGPPAPVSSVVPQQYDERRPPGPDYDYDTQQQTDRRDRDPRISSDTKRQSPGPGLPQDSGALDLNDSDLHLPPGSRAKLYNILGTTSQYSKDTQIALQPHPYPTQSHQYDEYRDRLDEAAHPQLPVPASDPHYRDHHHHHHASDPYYSKQQQYHHGQYHNDHHDDQLYGQYPGYHHQYYESDPREPPRDISSSQYSDHRPPSSSQYDQGSLSDTHQYYSNDYNGKLGTQQGYYNKYDKFDHNLSSTASSLHHVNQKQKMSNNDDSTSGLKDDNIRVVNLLQKVLDSLKDEGSRRNPGPNSNSTTAAAAAAASEQNQSTKSQQQAQKQQYNQQQYQSPQARPGPRSNTQTQNHAAAQQPDDLINDVILSQQVQGAAANTLIQLKEQLDKARSDHNHYHINANQNKYEYATPNQHHHHDHDSAREQHHDSSGGVEYRNYKVVNDVVPPSYPANSQEQEDEFNDLYYLEGRHRSQDPHFGGSNRTNEIIYDNHTNTNSNRNYVTCSVDNMNNHDLNDQKNNFSSYTDSDINKGPSNVDFINNFKKYSGLFNSSQSSTYIIINNMNESGLESDQQVQLQQEVQANINNDQDNYIDYKSNSSEFESNNLNLHILRKQRDGNSESDSRNGINIIQSTDANRNSSQFEQYSHNIKSQSVQSESLTISKSDDSESQSQSQAALLLNQNKFNLRRNDILNQNDNLSRILV